MERIPGPTELYEEIVKVAKPEEIGHWVSDLQCKVTPDTQVVVDRYDYKHLVTTFHSAIDNTLWFEIPFAFVPFWKGEVKC